MSSSASRQRPWIYWVQRPPRAAVRRRRRSSNCRRKTRFCVLCTRGRCVVTRSTELENEWPGPPTEGEPAEFAEKRSAILRKHREEVERAGGDGPEWGTVWAGAAVGLVTKVRYRAAKCRQLQQP